MSKELTPKEHLFISEYCNNGFNGTQAALKAGYSKKTAAAISSENLQKPYIREALKAHVDSVISKYKDTLEYEIIQTYKLLAFYNPDDIINKDGTLKKKKLFEYGELAKCIKGIQTTYNARGKKQVKVLLQDRDSALEKLSQYMKLLTQNIDITSKGEKINDFKEDEIDKMIEDKLKLINADTKTENKA